MQTHAILKPHEFKHTQYTHNTTQTNAIHKHAIQNKTLYKPHRIQTNTRLGHHKTVLQTPYNQPQCKQHNTATKTQCDKNTIQNTPYKHSQH